MRTILIQLDTDPIPSTFDRVVAIDAGVDELFSAGGVTPQNVVPLVHGAMFTRGPKDLKHTAIFIGGSDVRAGEALFEVVRKTFFGPVRVSVMMDSNGCNTTAAAAVLSAAKHLPLDQVDAAVLGGTGPVGLRAAELLARRGARVRVYSRSRDRAETACHALAERIPGTKLFAGELQPGPSLARELAGVGLLIAAGAAGVQFLGPDDLAGIESLRVAVDLNAVPPVGLGGIDVTDKSAARHNALCYGAIGVGGLKMKIHKAAVAQLFESNDQLLDAQAIDRIGTALVSAS